jgi:RNA-directed DNA polymerase
LKFGRFAAGSRERRGQGKPETFDFLGFTHICGKTRSERFTVLRQTMRKRLRAKLTEAEAELKRPMHTPIPEQGRSLSAVVGGHFRYYAVPLNGPALRRFDSMWADAGIALSRRSQNARPNCDRVSRLIARWLPVTRIHHPYPLPASALSSEARAGCG